MSWRLRLSVDLRKHEPYSHEWDAEGNVVVQRPASGHVTGIEPILRACGGTWIAHGGGATDRTQADRTFRGRGEQAGIVDDRGFTAMASQCRALTVSPQAQFSLDSAEGALHYLIEGAHVRTRSGTQALDPEQTAH